MSAVLEFAGVTVRRGEAVLLDSVDWKVTEEQRWVVLGPNGAGKTTLMQVASAQIHPTSGVAGILDEVLGTVDVFELRPRIGLTSAALAERIPRDERVRDVVVSASYGVVGRWREEYDELDHQRAQDLLVEVGVDRLADRTFGTLSEGERKRVQIARALMSDPELLLLDEPAAGLDLGGREDLVNTLSVLANDESSPATVLVSHHVEEIPPGFTHALLLRDGAVVASGPVREVITEENLSATFGLPLVLRYEAGRFSARRRARRHLGSRPWVSAWNVVAPDRVAGMDELANWLRDNMWGGWLTLAAVLGIAEMFSLDLVLIMLATGALGGMVTSLVTDVVVVQFLVAVVVSVGMLAVVRPGLTRRLHTGPELTLGHGKLVGSRALVTESITSQEPGRVRLAGEIWSAMPYDESLTIDAGETVEVFEIRGATAYVHPVPRLEG